MVNKIPIIIDTDPGIDDAVALSIALNSDLVDVRLLTTVAGNSNIDNVTNNAHMLTSFHNKDVPIARGSSEPLIAPLMNAHHIHGDTGLNGYKFELNNNINNKIDTHAVDAMREVITTSNKPITIVALGPLTNIALLLKMYPIVKENIERIVLMGGSMSRGNKGVYSEFNIAIDPEAAKIVFNSQVPLTMVTLDIGRKAIIDQDAFKEIGCMNRTGEMIYSLFAHYRKDGLNNGLKMFDVCAIAYVLAPKLFSTTNAFVDIELKGTYTYGASIVDLRGQYHQPNNTVVCIDINVEQFILWLKESIRKCN